MCGPQLGEVKEASQTYDKAVKQTGGDAPGLYKLMGQLARHSTVPGSGVSVETLESSLAPAQSLLASKLDDLEEAAPGILSQAILLPCMGVCCAYCLYPVQHLMAGLAALALRVILAHSQSGQLRSCV